MELQRRFELFGPAQGHPVTVAVGNGVDGSLTSVVARYAEPYVAAGTWNARQSLVQDALNACFELDDDTGKSLVFIDRDDGQRAIRRGCEAFGAVLTRRSKLLLGYEVVHPARARRLHDMLLIAEQIVDIAVSAGHGLVENPFRVAGYNTAFEAQNRSARIRQAKADGREPDYSMSTGRFFTVADAGWSVPRTEDPHFHDRVRASLVRFGAPPGFLAAWDFKEDVWCRPAEAIEAPFGALWFGAQEAREDGFGRLAMLRDKGRVGLVKLTAMTEPGAADLYRYIQDVRSLHDQGRGLDFYVAACRAGDPAALEAPIFLNTAGGPLKYDTARRRTFAPIMDAADLLYGGKRPGMHLGRHDKITTAVERIMALEVTVEVRERMLDDLVEFVGWLTGRRMLKVYAASLEVIERARLKVRFANQHAQPVLAGPVPALRDEDPECLVALFGDR